MRRGIGRRYIHVVAALLTSACGPQLTGAKALASEQWLDLLGNGWSKPYVSAVGRSELVDRPLGGASIDFNLGPEVQLERIDRIQLLTESSYWVAQ